MIPPWIYFAVRREHWTLVASKQRHIDSTDEKGNVLPVTMTHEWKYDNGNVTVLK